MADISKLTAVDWTDEDQSKAAIDAVCELIAVNPDDEEDEKVKQFVTRLRQTVGDIANAVIADTAEEGEGEGEVADALPPEGEGEGEVAEEGAKPKPVVDPAVCKEGVDWLTEGTLTYINEKL
jgi:hypothetical protein